MPIYFYSSTDDYAWLSNFSPHGFTLDDRYWPTVEHFFQAQKFAGTEYEEKIRQANSPKKAKSLGRRRDWPLRADWEEVKIDIMRRGVRAKFETHADIRATLLATGDEELIENAPNDYFWGIGRHGSGKNMLGKILMEVRAALRDDVPAGD
jgi:ribA/ribD-fused uncharacterized protein